MVRSTGTAARTKVPRRTRRIHLTAADFARRREVSGGNTWIVQRVSVGARRRTTEFQETVFPFTLQNGKTPISHFTSEVTMPLELLVLLVLCHWAQGSWP